MNHQLIHVRDEWLIILHRGGKIAEVLFKSRDEVSASRLMPILESSWWLGRSHQASVLGASRFQIMHSADEHWIITHVTDPEIIWSSPYELEAHLGLRAMRRAFTIGAIEASNDDTKKRLNS